MPEKSTTQTTYETDRPALSPIIVRGFIGVTVFILLFAVSISISPAQPLFAGSTADTTRSEKDQIAELIAKLDSGKFEEREYAAIKLAQIGEAAIGPLALKTFDCTPETCWRIKKTLEKICTNGTEEVFYKTTGILQLRFDSGTEEMNQRLSQLQAKWKKQRKKEAVAKLRDLGATIDDPWEQFDDQNAGANLQPVIQLGGFGRPAGVFIINGKVVEIESEALKSTKSTIRRARPQLSTKKQKIEIDKLLKSDLKEARLLVLGNEPKPKNPSANTALEIQQRLELRNAVFGGRAPSSTKGVTIELGEKWKGDSAGLKTLTEISNLTTVTLRKQKLDSKTIAAIAAIPTMTKLVLDSCQIDSKAIKKADWSNTLTEIELGKLVVRTEIVDSFKSIPSITVMTFRDCNFKGAGFNALKKLGSLRGLQFKDSEIPKELFGAIAELTQLSYLNFETCQFKTSDYKKLKKNRRNLQITYTAQAFLGVQGPMDLTGSQSDQPCVVTEVIAGSGAEKGGLKSNDLIESIDGEKIEIFEDLRLQVAQHHPGDTLDIRVKRGGKKVDLKVKLTGREIIAGLDR